jgi:L-amino acid N-acyltransferase YncA
MIIRHAAPADAPDMIALLQVIVDAGGTTAFEGTVPPDFIASVLDGSLPRSVAHVAEVEGEIIGFQYIKPMGDDPSLATIATFAKEGQTGRGIGSALFAETRDAAIGFGYGQIDATIRADNTGGLAYYSRMGFQDFEVFPNVPLSDGTPVDRVSKRLDLTS